MGILKLNKKQTQMKSFVASAALVAATAPATAPTAAGTTSTTAPIAPVAPKADDAPVAPPKVDDAATVTPPTKKTDEAPVVPATGDRKGPVAPTPRTPDAPVPAPVAGNKHTPIPCLTIPTTNEAWTIFTKIDADNSMTVTGKELEAAGKALSELHDERDANFDPMAAKAIREAVANFAKKHNGEIPLGAAI